MITWQELKDAREYAQMTQAELADKLGVALRTVQGWESRGVPAKAEYKLKRVLSLALDATSDAHGDDDPQTRLQNGKVTHLRGRQEAHDRPLSELSDWALLDELGKRLAERQSAHLTSQQRGIPTEEEAFKLGAVAKEKVIDVDEGDTTP